MQVVNIKVLRLETGTVSLLLHYTGQAVSEPASI